MMQAGNIIIAPPQQRTEPWRNAVITLCSNDVAGCWGVITNRRVESPKWHEIAKQFKIDWPKEHSVKLWYGGPVQHNGVICLHSPDYMIPNLTVSINEGLCMSESTKILTDIRDGKGPKTYKRLIGHCGWTTSQLQLEMERPTGQAWLQCDFNSDLVFSTHQKASWNMGIRLAGQKNTNETFAIV